MALSKNSIIELNLSAQEINIILDGLAAMPYKNVYHLIEKIHAQVNTQSNPTHIGNQDPNFTKKSSQ
jgi:hypothetical protein